MRRWPRSLALVLFATVGLALSASATDLSMITINAQAGDRVELQIYNLNGQPVFDSGIVSGRTLQWNLQNNSGQLVANGVYCYRVTVWDASGHATRSPIKELFVLR